MWKDFYKNRRILWKPVCLGEAMKKYIQEKIIHANA